MVLGIHQRSGVDALCGAARADKSVPESVSPDSAALLAPFRVSGFAPNAVSGPSGIPSDTQLAAAVAVTGAVLGDPMMMMMALQSELTAKGQDTQAEDIRQGNAHATIADALQLEQFKKAAKAAEKAAKKGPPWVKKLIGAILTAVGTVASIAGGAGLAIVAVGAALIIGAKLVEKVLTTLADKGVISEKAAMIVSTVVKIVAAVAAAVTGQVGGLTSAATTVASTAVEVGKTAAEIVKSVQQIVQAAVDIAYAGVDMHAQVRTYQADMANIMAEQWGIESDGQLANVETAIDGFKRIQESYNRMVKTATTALAIQDRTRSTALQGMA